MRLVCLIQCGASCNDPVVAPDGWLRGWVWLLLSPRESFVLSLRWLWLLLGVLVWHAIWRQGPVVEADLSARVATALAALEATHVRVDVDGQEISLHGSLTAETLRRPLLQAAAKVWGVVAVHDHLDIVPAIPAVDAVESAVQQSQGLGAEAPAPVSAPSSPPSLTPSPNSAPPKDADAQPESVPLGEVAETAPLELAAGVELERAEAVIRLSGEVDSPATRERLSNAVRSLHPGYTLEETVRVTRSAPLPWNDWLRALELLRPLEATQVALTPDGLSIGGRSSDLATAVNVRDAIGAERSFEAASVDIQAPAAASDVCQTLYNSLLAQESIRFPSNSSEIDPVSHGLLDRLSDAFARMLNSL